MIPLTHMTQEEKIKNLIERNGSVSRNQALDMRITRLGAIINKLNKQGHIIKGRFEPTEHGKDYVYYKQEIKYQKQLW